MPENRNAKMDYIRLEKFCLNQQITNNKTGPDLDRKWLREFQLRLWSTWLNRLERSDERSSRWQSCPRPRRRSCRCSDSGWSWTRTFSRRWGWCPRMTRSRSGWSGSAWRSRWRTWPSCSTSSRSGTSWWSSQASLAKACSLNRAGKKILISEPKP